MPLLTAIDKDLAALQASVVVSDEIWVRVQSKVENSIQDLFRNAQLELSEQRPFHSFAFHFTRIYRHLYSKATARHSTNALLDAEKDGSEDDSEIKGTAQLPLREELRRGSL